MDESLPCVDTIERLVGQAIQPVIVDQAIFMFFVVLWVPYLLLRPQNMLFHNVCSVRPQILAKEARGDVPDTATSFKYPGSGRKSQ